MSTDLVISHISRDPDRETPTLSASQRLILEILLDNAETKEKPLSLSQIATLAHMQKDGEVHNQLCQLRRFGLVEYCGCGAARASGITLKGICALTPLSVTTGKIVRYIRTQSRRNLNASRSKNVKPENARTLNFTANALEIVAAEIERNFA